MKKILLTGYMASGKTTTALLLSKAAGIIYKDLDEILEESTGKSVAQIFAESGEIAFRRVEHEALKEVLNHKEAFVLSMGGGTPCYANNHEFLQQDDVVSVYLKAGISELGRRLSVAEHKRPLLDNVKPEELEEFIAKHLFDRSYYYHQAKHIINVEGKTPEAIVNEIMSLL